MANTNPVVSWSSPAAGSTIAYDTDLFATTSAAGTAKVTRACLTINGQVPAQDYARPGYSPGTYDGNGCWTNTDRIYNMTLRVDTTGWSNGDYTFAWTVTDSNNRVSATASRTFKKK